jgi:hypothetical protein
VPFRLAPRPNQLPVKGGTVSFPGAKQPEGGADHHLRLAPGSEWEGAIRPPPLCACLCMPWGDLCILSRNRVC